MSAGEGHDRSTPLTYEAAELFIRGRTRLNGHECRAYLQWLQATPTHMAEMLRLELLHQVLGEELRSMRAEEFRMEKDSGSKVVDIVTGEPFVGPPEPRPKRWKFPSAGKVAAGAVAIVVIALGGLVAKTAWEHRWIETGAAELRTHSTPDGSEVRIGPNSKLRFIFDDNRRFVHLQHGEAYFDVAKDAARPFIVETGSFETQAVGTGFAVTRRADFLRVTVQEGGVSVRHRQDGKDVSVPVTAGQQLVVSKHWPVEAKQSDVGRELAWMEGKLIFDGETVATAVAEFNYRNNVTIVVEDAAIGARRFSGVLAADDPEGFAKFLETNEALSYEWDGSRVLRVVARKEGSEENARR